jgi:hypothetical protein
MKAKEECAWCLFTQHVRRSITPPMPKELQFRCSTCHEEWTEENQLLIELYQLLKALLP